MKNRRGRNCGDERHDHGHRKQARRKDSKVETQIQDDQFHQPPRIHQYADACRQIVVESGQTRRDVTAPKFADKGEEDNDAADGPLFQPLHEADLGAQPGERKENGALRRNPTGTFIYAAFLNTTNSVLVAAMR